MTVTQHIRDQVFAPRLKARRILVVHDPEGRYEGICDSLTSPDCQVIKAERRPVSARLEALETWQQMSKDAQKDRLSSQLLVYLRRPTAKSTEEKIHHPFLAFIAAGAQFPDGPADEFQQICLRCLPDRRTEVARLFSAQTEPTLAEVDQLSQGPNAYPRLVSTFGTSEVKDVVRRFLVPDPRVEQNLGANTDWRSELERLLIATLDFPFDPDEDATESIRERLWQYLLFSEFAADLPVPLPASLAPIPHAEAAAIGIVRDLCQSLRRDSEYREAYQEVAERVQRDLDLERECAAIADLGPTDTFAFEESRFLERAAHLILSGQRDEASAVIERHQNSVWASEGERSLLWKILQSALHTLAEIKLARERLKPWNGTGHDLATCYVDGICRVDTHHREVEMVAAKCHDGYHNVERVVDLVRTAYRDFFNELQSLFLRSVDREGWPFDQLESNQNLFDKAVRPHLQEGRRVVYLLVDALRWEVAQQLAGLLADGLGNISLEPAASQLPGVTSIAMAALLPNASERLRLEVIEEKLTPIIDGMPVDGRARRMAAFRAEYNERFAEMHLRDFLVAVREGAARQELERTLERVQLFVITSTELDELGEAGLNLSDHIPETLTQLIRAIRAAVTLKFNVAVVAADHGFIWLETADASLRADPPVQGDWSLAKRRCYIGKGDPALGSKAYATAELSIPTQEPTLIVPQNLAVYTAGQSYFHEGLSLQECIVGKLVIRFPDRQQSLEATGTRSRITLSRRRNVVSSLIVSVNVAWSGTPDMFASPSLFIPSVLQKGNPVGEPVSGPGLDPSTGYVSLRPGDEGKISLRLTSEATEGNLAVVLADAKTGKRVASLELTYQPNIS